MHLEDDDYSEALIIRPKRIVLLETRTLEHSGEMGFALLKALFPPGQENIQKICKEAFYARIITLK